MNFLRLAASRSLTCFPFLSKLRCLYRKCFDKNFIFRSSFELNDTSKTYSAWDNSNFLFYQKRRLEALSSKTSFQSDDILSFFLNTVSSVDSSKRYQVLDWGGGTGCSWFRVFKTLTCSKSFSWRVCDNSNLASIGKEYSLVNKIPIEFSENYLSCKVDILYICSALQYVSYQEFLPSLLLKRPKYLIFEGLHASALGSFTVIQNLYGASVPCEFISYEEFINFIFSYGYSLVYSSVNQNASHILRTNFRYPRSLERFASSHLAYDLIFLLL